MLQVVRHTLETAFGGEERRIRRISFNGHTSSAFFLTSLSPLSDCICTCFEMNLHIAAKDGKLERVRLLVEQGANKDKGDRNGDHPLYLASFQGRLDVVQYLVEQGASLDKVNNDDWTPLTCAVVRGHLKVVRYLLEQGADRDKSDNIDMTPLHYAARCSRLEIAMLLMSYGADLNARNTSSKLPIDVACTKAIKQAIRDEPRRRMDHGIKRATQQDRHPNAAAASSFTQHDDGEDGKQSNKRQRLEKGIVAVAVAVVAEGTKVASKYGDSGTSSCFTSVSELLQMVPRLSTGYPVDTQLDLTTTTSFISSSSSAAAASTLVASWEASTKGIGSKLLMNMGFVPGQGLGKQEAGEQLRRAHRKHYSDPKPT